jgi:protease II
MEAGHAGSAGRLECLKGVALTSAFAIKIATQTEHREH